MKLKEISLTVAAAFALGLAGCSKNEPATPVVEDADKAAVSAADAAAKSAEAARVEAVKAAETAKVEAEKAAEAARVEAAKAAQAVNADSAKAADNTRIQGLIDQAKSLVADGKYSDAATLLQQLTGQTLSADQTNLVASIKEQIQKALAAKAAENAAGAAGNLLKR